MFHGNVLVLMTAILRVRMGFRVKKEMRIPCAGLARTRAGLLRAQVASSCHEWYFLPFSFLQSTRFFNIFIVSTENATRFSSRRDVQNTGIQNPFQCSHSSWYFRVTKEHSYFSNFFFHKLIIGNTRGKEICGRFSIRCTGHLGLCYCIISVPPDEKPVLGFLS